MKIYLASDHGGFERKEFLKKHLVGFDVEDLGNFVFNEKDDYPPIIEGLAKAVRNTDSMGIIFGLSGQGEAIVANRFSGIRAVVYNNTNLEVVQLAREHNNANVLSIGAKFLSDTDVVDAVNKFLETKFSKEERHYRRIRQIDELNIVPAVLCTKQNEIEKNIDSIKKACSFVQIDIVDGIFGEMKTWPYTNKLFDNYGFLNKLDVQFELDLMIKNVDTVLDKYIKTNASRIIIHLTSTDKMDECIDKVKASGKSVYIAFGIEDSFDELNKYIDKIDGVQCMGIVNIGKQGEVLDKRVFHNIKVMKDLGIDISVDGGINKENINLFKGYVDRVCLGSAIFGEGDATSNYLSLS